MKIKKRVKKITRQMDKFLPEKPLFAITLGSGLTDFVDAMENKKHIKYSQIKGMLKTTVKGHGGQFVFGYIKNRPILVMQGRFHLYEGYSAKEVVIPIYVFKLLGIKNFIITNAAGAVNQDYNPGD
ncbi:MAG: purine-nucleoside phosphorylase, partial [Candidatus Woesearchaeota archaeon]